MGRLNGRSTGKPFTAQKKAGELMATNRRRDALQQALLNAIRYQCLEWDLSQEDVLAALADARTRVRELFEQGNRDANQKRKRPKPEEGDE